MMDSSSRRSTLRLRVAGWSIFWMTMGWMCGCSPVKKESIYIAISGDTAGWITPCGCAANQSGGLERRATLLRSLGKPERVLYLDAGGSASGISEYQQLKLASILRGDRTMGLEVHNIGARETMLAPRDLRELSNQTGVVFLSANLESKSQEAKETGVAFSGHQIVRRGEARILIIGVIDPGLVKNSQWKTKDAASSVLSILEREPADIRIVLAYMDEPKLRSLAQSLPEVDFIVGGPTGQMLAPTQMGSTQIMSATNKGKFLASIELQKEDSRWQAIQSGPLEVSSSLERDAAQMGNMDDFLAKLAARDFSASESGLVSSKNAERISSAYAVAGSDSCKSCHGPDTHLWLSSKHSHAWQTLETKKSHVDPACQQCHTTGYGLEGGFRNVAESTARVNVGCESCHGPSLAHVQNPKIKTPYLSREQCVRCHDHENSPTFQYDVYWSRIKHGP